VGEGAGLGRPGAVDELDSTRSRYHDVDDDSMSGRAWPNLQHCQRTRA
jgi:hypothetical protein